MYAGLQKRRGAKLFNDTVGAEWIAGFANVASVKNQQVREDDPILLWHKLD